MVVSMFPPTTHYTQRHKIAHNFKLSQQSPALAKDLIMIFPVSHWLLQSCLEIGDH
jgi:hypothetical protein